LVAQFVVIAKDRPGGLARRQAVREAHLAYARGQKIVAIRLAGPFLDEGGEMCGSLFIFEAGDRGQVEAYLAEDPYVTGDLFESIEIRPWRVTIPWT
jgi:hypothetical protein